MHVIKIRDRQGVKRIYAAKFIRRTDETVIFDFKGTELVIANKDLIDMVSVDGKILYRIH